jgi:hypothetical protein
MWRGGVDQELAGFVYQRNALSVVPLFQLLRRNGRI